jgi:4,5-dihydroxyphthalate decarboxylase
MALALTMTCGEYDRSRALIDGRVKPQGIDLTVEAISSDPARQARARRGEFDACEFYMGLYLADMEEKTLGFMAIPIFVKRMFRHSYIYVNKRSRIRGPADLNGKRVGVQTWFTTTALWARGMLADEYGVDLRSIDWTVEKAVAIGSWAPPDWLRLRIAPPGEKGVVLFRLLAEGTIDAAITTDLWAPDVHPDIDFLFPNYPAVEREYFARTRYFPIMHTFLIRTAVLNRDPWVAMSFFDAWQRSKEAAYEWLDRQRVHLTSMWFRGLWEEERALAGTRDIYPWGFGDTRAEVHKMCEYAFRQGITPRQYAPEELFHSTTLST